MDTRPAINERSIRPGEILLRILIVSSPLLLNDFYLKLVPRDAEQLNLTLDVLIYVCWQTTIIFLAYRARWFSIEDLGLTKQRLGRQVLWGLVILLAAFVFFGFLSFVFMMIKKHFQVELPDIWYFPMPKWHPFLAFLHAIYISITAGVYEEVVYRGIVISQLRKLTSNPWILVIGSSLVFMLIHWSLDLKIWALAFVLGVFWAYLFLRQGRLIPIIIAHFLFDLLSQYELDKWLMAKIGIM